MLNRLTIKYKALWEVLFISLLFLYVYSPKFILIGGTTKILAFIILFYFAINPRVILEYFKSKAMMNISYILLTISIMSIILPIMHGTDDFSFSIYFLTALIVNLPITFFFIHIFKDKLNINFESILRYLFIISSIQAAFVLLGWFFQPFGQLILTTLVFSFDAENYYRATGVSYGTGDGLSFIQAIGFMAGFYILLNYRSNFYKNTFFWILIFISMIFIGRTGMLLSLLFVGVYSSIVFRYKAILLFKLTIIIIFSTLLIMFLSQYIVSDKFEHIIKWAFEFYFSYFESGKIGTKSTNALYEMFFLPTTELSIIFGDGYYENPYDKESNYIASDSGYIRTIFFGGFFIMGFILTYYIYLLSIFKKMMDKKEFKFILVLFFIYFVGHLKVSILYYGVTMRILLVLLVVVYFSRHRKKSNM